MASGWMPIRAQSIPYLTQEQPYAVERQKLLSAGWQKVLKPQRSCNELAEPAKTTCYRYPEVEDCSGNGYCKFGWRNSRGEILGIMTFGMNLIITGWGIEQ
jgi:hypothetical protein